METSSIYVRSILETVGQGILASNAGTPTLGWSEEEAYCRGYCDHYGQYSSSELMDHGTGVGDLS